MRKSENTKFTLFILFSVTVVVSNIISAKILWTPLTILNTPAVLPGSAFVYLLTFMISGLINELWGKDTAKQCVKFGLMSQIVALVLFWLTGLLPAADQDFQNAYQTVLGRNFVFVASDVVAGFTAQFTNVFLFPLLKNINPKNNPNLKPKNSGLMNCISILISQLFDTVIFMTCAFGIGLGFLFTLEGRMSLLTMFIGQYAIKIIVCAASIPVFNVVAKKVKKGEPETQEVKELKPVLHQFQEEPQEFSPYVVFYSKKTARFEICPAEDEAKVSTENSLYPKNLKEWLNSTIHQCDSKNEAEMVARNANSKGMFPVLCKECDQYFMQDRDTVQWYKKRNLTVPKRCPKCRESRKARNPKKIEETT